MLDQNAVAKPPPGMDFNPDQCWFCKAKEAKDIQAHVRVDLYRKGKLLGEEKDKDGKTIQKFAWDTVKFPVPRCADCFHVHHNRSLYAVGPTLLVMSVLGATLYYQYKSMVPGDDPFFMVETLVYGLCALIFGSSYSVSKLKQMNLSVPKPMYGNAYPVLDKLKGEGWMLGKVPYGGGGSGDAQLAKKKSAHLPS